METYIALLRGINVGGHRSVKMAAVAASCEALGLDRVRTYLQSGNVVFGAPSTATARLAGRIEARLQRDLGQRPAVLVKAARDWNLVLERNPFATEPGIDPAKLHVTFPFAPLPKSAPDMLAALKSGRDRYALSDGAIYLYCPDGYGRSRLSNAVLERALSVTATTRNWRTVNELHRLSTE